MTVRDRLASAFAGEEVRQPVYGVYDVFLKSPLVDWNRLFSLGLAVITHVQTVKMILPNAEVSEEVTAENDVKRYDTTWTTDKGVLHESFRGDADKGLLPWREEYMIKQPEDYAILRHALEDAEFVVDDTPLEKCEKEYPNNGFEIATLDRSPFQKISVDYAGIERLSFDLADGEADLFALLELMNHQFLLRIEAAAKSRAQHLKLWENLSIETLGPGRYRDFLVPRYRQAFDILEGTGKGLHVHYDGKLRSIAADISGLPFWGIDSFTPPPEGDLEVSEARTHWPDLFLWVHPSLTWFDLPVDQLKKRIHDTIDGAGPSRYCLQLSESIPSRPNETIPIVLSALEEKS